MSKKTYDVELRKVTCVNFKIKAETYDEAVQILNKRLHGEDYRGLIAEFEKCDIEREFYYIPSITYV